MDQIHYDNFPTVLAEERHVFLPSRPELDWFALRVAPRHEKAVVRTLQNKGYETILPLYRKKTPNSLRSRISELPLFPGYVFCRFDIFQRLPVLITPGVVHIVGTGRVPVPVDATEMASLQQAMQAGLVVEPCPFLNVGQTLRITEGALAGIEGILLQVKKSFRLVLSVTLLHRSVQVEVDRDWVVEYPETTAPPTSIVREPTKVEVAMAAGAY